MIKRWSPKVTMLDYDGTDWPLAGMVEDANGQWVVFGDANSGKMCRKLLRFDPRLDWRDGLYEAEMKQHSLGGWVLYSAYLKANADDEIQE